MDQYFLGKNPTKEQFQKLSQSLEDWLVKGDVIVFRWFRIWERSGYKTLPYEGGWLDQPTWLTEAFDTLLSVGFWHEINEGLANVDGLKNIEEG